LLFFTKGCTEDDRTLVLQDLITALKKQYKLNWHGMHGISHFLRVRENALRLAEITKAKPHIVELFAFLHDSRRLNEGHDRGHGRRAARYARLLQGTFFELEPEDLALLEFACEFHAEGLMEGDVTVQTCWDADRLDLGRVGKKPRASKLCTAAAKAPEIMDWAYRRSLQR
jgi:uncharacterized protein